MLMCCFQMMAVLHRDLGKVPKELVDRYQKKNNIIEL